MKIVKVSGSDVVKFELLIAVNDKDLYSRSRMLYIENLECNSKKYESKYSVVLMETNTGYNIYMPAQFMHEIKKDSIVLNLDEYKELINQELEIAEYKCLEKQLGVMRNDYKNNKNLIIKYSELTQFYIENMPQFNEHYIKLAAVINEQQECIVRNIPNAKKGFNIPMKKLINMTNYKSETRRMQ